MVMINRMPVTIDVREFVGEIVTAFDITLLEFGAEYWLCRAIGGNFIDVNNEEDRQLVASRRLL